MFLLGCLHMPDFTHPTPHTPFKHLHPSAIAVNFFESTKTRHCGFLSNLGRTIFTRRFSLAFPFFHCYESSKQTICVPDFQSLLPSSLNYLDLKKKIKKNTCHFLQLTWFKPFILVLRGVLIRLYEQPVFYHTSNVHRYPPLQLY